MSEKHNVPVKRHPFTVLAVFAIAFALQGMSLAVFHGDRPARRTNPAVPKAVWMGAPIVATNTFTVTTVEDGGPGSLRQAIAEANESEGLDAIRFDFSEPVTITLFSPLPVITDPVSIEAPGPWITNTGRLTIDGSNVSGAEALFVISEAAGSSIRRMRLVNFSSGYGFLIAGGSDGTVVISNTIQHGNGGIQLQNSGQISITHNTLLDLVDTAVEVEGGTGNWVQENAIRNIGGTGIRLLDGVRDAVIISNTLSGIGVTGIHLMNGIQDAFVISNTIAGDGAIGFRGIQLQNTAQISITNNALLDLVDTAVEVEGGTGIWVQENAIRNIGGAGIRLIDGVRDGAVISNTLSGIGVTGIHLLDGVQQTFVISNTVAGNGTVGLRGIQLQNSGLITLTHNTLLDLVDAAVEVEGGTGIWVRENAIRNIGGTGIRLIDGIHDAFIISNTISGIGGGVGISAAGSPAPTGVVMRSNTFTDTVKPISLGPGANGGFPAPEILQAFLPFTETIALSARSPADPATYVYPLSLDLYRVRNGNYVPLGVDLLYDAENFPASITYTVALTDVFVTDHLAMIATTANPSTSEFSPPVVLSSAAADLSIVKTLVDFSGDPGTDTITAAFRLTVTNHGPSDATGVVVDDPLPTGAALVSASGAYDPVTGRWTLGALGAGDSATLTIVLTADAEHNLFNRAEVSGDLPDPDPGNNIAATLAQHDPPDLNRFVADLSLTKTVDDETPSVDGTVVYTLAVTNHGPSATAGVKVREVLSDSLVFVSAETTSQAGQCPACGYDDALGVWTVGHLAQGATATLEITARVAGTGEIVNTAEIYENHLPDRNGENDTASATISVSSRAQAKATAVENAGVPTVFALHQNYPNPFNPNTIIAFQLPEPRHVVLRVFDILGHEVTTLVNEEMGAGTYQVEWDGRSAQGRPVASGVYLYRIEAGDFSREKTMILLR